MSSLQRSDTLDNEFGGSTRPIDDLGLCVGECVADVFDELRSGEDTSTGNARICKPTLVGLPERDLRDLAF
jgi:hypothetical protein